MFAIDKYQRICIAWEEIAFSWVESGARRGHGSDLRPFRRRQLALPYRGIKDNQILDTMQHFVFDFERKQYP